MSLPGPAVHSTPIHPEAIEALRGTERPVCQPRALYPAVATMCIKIKTFGKHSVESVRHFVVTGLVSLLLVVLAGCVRSEGIEPCPANCIGFESTISGSQMRGDQFTAGDTIGIFANEWPGSPGEGNYAYNTPYTFDGTNWTASGGAPLPWPGAQDLAITAYWPYDAAVTEGDLRSYPFLITTDQTTLDNYLRNDFLWSQSARQSPAEPVPLNFSHSMSRLQVNVVSSFEAGENWPGEARVFLLGLRRETTIDLTDGTVSGPIQSVSATGRQSPTDVELRGSLMVEEDLLPREEDDIEPLMLNTVVPGYDLSVAAVVLPQTLRPNIPLVHVHLDGVDYAYLPPDEFTFIPGTNYTLNLTLIEGEPGLVLDLDEVDFGVSRVWNVYHGTNIVAQVCREYINGPQAYDVQAAVVYPATSSGPDFSGGFAARVYSNVQNSSGGYDIIDEPVHGGSVNFSSGTLYTPGALSAVRKVSVDPQTGISAAPATSPTDLTVAPVTVSDIDNNAYPIVKINTSYWTASNLRTSRFMNGAYLSYYIYGNPANYGLLYPSTTVTDFRGLMPSPWRVGTVNDYDYMFRYLEPESIMKVRANGSWQTDVQSNDVSGFSLIPAGWRSSGGFQSGINIFAYLWTANTSFDGGSYYYIDSYSPYYSRGTMDRSAAMSVRFVLTDPSALTAD